MPATKIATCCFCGTRAALVLTGEARHELACQGCGAPLHNLKMLPKQKVHRPVAPALDNRSRGGGRGIADAVLAAGLAAQRGRKKKRRKSLGKRVLKEAFDLFDEIFD